MMMMMMMTRPIAIRTQCGRQPILAWLASNSVRWASELGQCCQKSWEADRSLWLVWPPWSLPGTSMLVNRLDLCFKACWKVCFERSTWNCFPWMIHIRRLVFWAEGFLRLARRLLRAPQISVETPIALHKSWKFHKIGRWGAVFQAILENQYHDGVVVEALSFFKNWLAASICRWVDIYRSCEALFVFFCWFLQGPRP